MKFSLAIPVAFALALGVAPMAQAQVGTNMITNGNFSNGLTGWTVNQIPQIAAPFATLSPTESIVAATVGSLVGAIASTPVLDPGLAPTSFAAFNLSAGTGGSVGTNNGGYLEQSFQTVAGTAYVLSFVVYNFANSNGTRANIQAQVSGLNFNTVSSLYSNSTPDNDFNTPGNTVSQQLNGYSFSFFGTGGTLTLDIADLSCANISGVQFNACTPGSSIPLVYNVQVIDVPEPMSIVLLGTGLLGLGAVRRTRQG